MISLSYQDYAVYYASKCNICHGEKRVKVENVWTACVCQQSASLKFKFEQFEVDPPELKYKSWNDFDGFLRDKNGKKVQIISTASWCKAKQQALDYCFGSSEPEVLKNRRKHLVVHKHRYDGQNVIIIGHEQCGRTLLASLIIKEVAYACRIHNLDLTFKYIKAYDLMNAARWSNEVGMNRVLLDDIEDTDFLVIDEVGLLPAKGHHTYPADYYTMNVLFRNRTMHSLPTIVIRTDAFWMQATESKYEDVSSQWGRSFLSLMNDPKNVIIKMERSRAKSRD